MTVFLGLELDEGAFLADEAASLGRRICGPSEFLFLLENQLGLTGHLNDVDYLRIEQYRQAIHHFLQEQKNCFFSKSFEADQFATAHEMLRRRDELASAGFEFSAKENMPERVQIITEIEQILINEPNLLLTKGRADRINAVIEALEHQKTAIQKIFVNEPIHLQTIEIKRLLNALEKQVEIEFLNVEEKQTKPTTDLEVFQHSIKNGRESDELLTFKNDGSLLILKSKRANEAATWIAKFVKENEDFGPVCLIPKKNRGLDNAFIQEGIPSLGIPSASLARPSLQILKLVPAFLWEPIDPFKILEFVSLAVKPLDDGLGYVIARLMAAKPGLNSEEWKRGIEGYFGQLLNNESVDPVHYQHIRKEYAFWFERKRHNINSTVPKREVVEIFEKLEVWALEVFEEEGGKNTSLIVLSEQARRIKELLLTLPETKLNFLELERIVRTI